jgi:hypothetical protein
LPVVTNDTDNHSGLYRKGRLLKRISIRASPTQTNLVERNATRLIKDYFFSPISQRFRDVQCGVSIGGELEIGYLTTEQGTNLVDISSQ